MQARLHEIRQRNLQYRKSSECSCKENEYCATTSLCRNSHLLKSNPGLQYRQRDQCCCEPNQYCSINGSCKNLTGKALHNSGQLPPHNCHCCQSHHH